MMKACSICGKISASGEDHLDCVEKRRLEEKEDEVAGRAAPDASGISDGENIAGELKALLDHMRKNRD